MAFPVKSKTIFRYYTTNNSTHQRNQYPRILQRVHLLLPLQVKVSSLKVLEVKLTRSRLNTRSITMIPDSQEILWKTVSEIANHLSILEITIITAIALMITPETVRVKVMTIEIVGDKEIEAVIAMIVTTMTTIVVEIVDVSVTAIVVSVIIVIVASAAIVILIVKITIVVATVVVLVAVIAVKDMIISTVRIRDVTEAQAEIIATNERVVVNALEVEIEANLDTEVEAALEAVIIKIAMVVEIRKAMMVDI